MAPRSQPYRLEWPLNASQLEAIDDMFQILFDDVRNGSIFPLTTEGDIIFQHNGAATRLAVGAANTVLRSNGTDPLWGKADLANDVTGVLPAVNGGTGNSSYTIGDILYANSATTLAKLADVAAGSYLRSGGVGAAPVWSTLTLPNAASKGEIPYASAANVISMLAVGTAGQVLTTQGAGNVPTWTTPSSGGGITGLLTNGDPTNPELIFDSFGDIITVT